MRKGENAGHQQFLHFPQCFQKISISGLSKSRDCVVKGCNWFLPVSLVIRTLKSDTGIAVNVQSFLGGKKITVKLQGYLWTERVIME